VSQRSVGGADLSCDGWGSVKYIISDSNNFARLFIDQKRVTVHAHPDRAIGRRRQVVNREVDQPVIPRPEGGGQEFAERPAMGIPARRTAVGRGIEAARDIEVAMIVAEAAEIAARTGAALAEIGAPIAIEVAIEIPAGLAIAGGTIAAIVVEGAAIVLVASFKTRAAVIIAAITVTANARIADIRNASLTPNTTPTLNSINRMNEKNSCQNKAGLLSSSSALAWLCGSLGIIARISFARSVMITICCA